MKSFLKRAGIAKIDLVLAFILIAISVAGRLLPHPVNFTPVAAAGILAFALMQNKLLAYAVPALALFISNLFLPADNGWVFFFVSAGMVVPAALGRLLKSALAGGPVLKKSILTGTFSALCFFIISNAGVFFFSGLYPVTGAGFLSCYAMALPFLLNSLLGDILFTGSMVALARVALPAHAPAIAC